MNYVLRLLAIVQLVWYCCLATPAQKPLGVNDQTLFAEDFNDLVTRLLVQWHTPGVAISVINDRSVFGRVWSLTHPCPVSQDCEQMQHY